MSSSSFLGTDVSWLATDIAGYTAWLVTNGSGVVPAQLCADPTATFQQEDLLRDWVTQQGRPFRFGAENSQWIDVTQLGLLAFDWNLDTEQFCLTARPDSALPT